MLGATFYLLLREVASGWWLVVSRTLKEADHDERLEDGDRPAGHQPPSHQPLLP